MPEPKLVSFENTFMEDRTTLSSSPDSDTQGALACVTIDGYPADENAKGCVVAKVWMTNARQIIVDWHRNDYRMNSDAVAAVQDSIQTLRNLYPVTGLPQYHPKAAEALAKLKEAETLLADMSGKAPGHYTVDCYIRDIGRAFHHHCNNYEDAEILAHLLFDAHKVDGCIIYADDTCRLEELLGYCGY